MDTKKGLNKDICMLASSPNVKLSLIAMKNAPHTKGNSCMSDALSNITGFNPAMCVHKIARSTTYEKKRS